MATDDSKSETKSKSARLYRDLADSHDQIRLLEIYPGLKNDAIETKLEVYNRSEIKHYEALSYTWGDEPSDLSININGHPFQIRFNLFSALQRLRQRDKIRLLWIDALCI